MLSQSRRKENNVERCAGSGARTRVDLRGQDFCPSKNGTVLLQNNAMEVASFRMSAGEQCPLHSARGEAVIYCVNGYARLLASDRKYDLAPGMLVCLAATEPHRLEGIEDATLLTVNSRPSEPQVRVRHEPAVATEKDVVQEAAEESLPAKRPAELDHRR